MSRPADTDESIPVGLEMPDFDRTGNIISRQDTDHAGQGLCLFRMDTPDDGRGILAAHGTAITHARQINLIKIVYILSGSQYFPFDVNAVAGRTYLRIFGFFRYRRSLIQHIRCQGDGVDNFLVTGAATDIIADGRGYLYPVRPWIGINERFAAHDHTGNTEAALHGPGFSEGIDEYVLFTL